MINTIVFDLGGVLIDWNPEYVFLKEFRGDREKMNWFFEEICTSEWNENQDAGYPLRKATEERVELFPAHESLDSFLGTDFNGMSVADKLTEQTGVIGEKIEIGGFERLEGAFVGSYIHAGNKIATLTSLSAGVDGAAEVAKNVAMQAAAMNPIALNEEGVDAATVEKEIEIAKDQLRQEGKPEAMLDNIAKGKLKRFYKDNTLVNQTYIKNGKLSVSDYVKSVDAGLAVTGFKRVALL